MPDGMEPAAMAPIGTESGAGARAGEVVVAQLAGPGAAQPTVVGEVTRASGDVRAIRGSTTVELGPGDPVYREDVIETGADGSLAVRFLDRTALTLTGDSRVALEDIAFEPASSSSSFLMSVTHGIFRLITGRAPVHTFSRTQTNPLLGDLMRENELWVNAQTARSLGVKSGQYVQLSNQDGVTSNRVRVKATQRIRPDTVYMVYGFGHTNRMLKSAYLKGASAAQLNTRYATDPLMGGTSIHGNFVTLVEET